MNAALLALVRMVLGHARLRRMARRVLQAAPAVQARLQLWMHRSALRAPGHSQPAGGAQLSLRARQLHRQLKRARGGR